MTTASDTPRTPSQLRALRRFALTWAWDQAYHAAACFVPGTVSIPAKARALLARGWVEAKLAEKHGHLVVAEAADKPALAAPAARTAAFIRREIDDLENRDRLGIFGLARLSSLRAELLSAEYRAAA